MGSISTPQDDFDYTITDDVVSSVCGPKADSRLREIVPNLVRHLHAFCRESRITRSEFQAALQLVAQAGKASTDEHNHVGFLAIIFGSEALFDDITRVTEEDKATENFVLGPFWREDAPHFKMGDSIVKGFGDAPHTYLHGMIVDSITGKPIPNATIDLWQSAPDGTYDVEDSKQVMVQDRTKPHNLRGVFTTGEDGKYSLYCLRPVPYPVPLVGPAGDLLRLLDREETRAAHIHILIKAPGYKDLVTQLFDREDEKISKDVLVVKRNLIVDFVKRKNDPKAQFEVEFTFKVAPEKA